MADFYFNHYRTHFTSRRSLADALASIPQVPAPCVRAAWCARLLCVCVCKPYPILRATTLPCWAFPNPQTLNRLICTTTTISSMDGAATRRGCRTALCSRVRPAVVLRTALSGSFDKACFSAGLRRPRPAGAHAAEPPRTSLCKSLWKGCVAAASVHLWLCRGVGVRAAVLLPVPAAHHPGALSKGQRHVRTRAGVQRRLCRSDCCQARPFAALIACVQAQHPPGRRAAARARRRARWCACWARTWRWQCRTRARSVRPTRSSRRRRMTCSSSGALGGQPYASTPCLCGGDVAAVLDTACFLSHSPLKWASGW